MKTLRSQLDPLIREAGIGRVAELAGLHRPDLSAWLSGRRRLHDDKLERVCSALGVEIVVRAAGAQPAKPRRAFPVKRFVMRTKGASPGS